MNALQTIDFSWTGLVGGTRTAVSCFSGRGGMLDCQPVWTGLVIAVVLIAAFAVVVVLRYLVRDYLRHRAAMKRWKADQTIAPDEEMAKVKWRGDQSESDTRSQAEIASEIKRALEKNKGTQKQP